jgi:hypothetical protein
MQNKKTSPADAAKKCALNDMKKVSTKEEKSYLSLICNSAKTLPFRIKENIISLSEPTNRLVTY